MKRPPRVRRRSVALAAKGVTSVLVDSMWSTVVNGKQDWFSKVRTTDTDYQHSIDQVVDLRRALDLLTAQSGVDPADVAAYRARMAPLDPLPYLARSKAPRQHVFGGLRRRTGRYSPS